MSNGPGSWDDGVELSAGEPPRPDHAVYQAFPNQPTPIGIDPKDGLARPAISHAMKDAQSPWVTHETFVCMADFRKFVRRDQSTGDVLNEFLPKEVERAPNGKWRSKLEMVPGYSDWVEVEPVRKQCKYYRRQWMPHPGDAEHRIIFRLCTARQTDEGQFLDMGDSAMFACELRDPRDATSDSALEDADQEIVALSIKKLAEERGEPEFDVDAALADERKTDPFTEHAHDELI